MTLGEIVRQLKLGKVFRKMGLPMWTFVGVGIAAVWFNTLSSLLERLMRTVMGLEESTGGLLGMVPLLTALAVPFLLVLVLALVFREDLFFPPRPYQHPKNKKGIILLVSNADSAAFAIEYHLKEPASRLEKVWLIPSDDREETHFGPGTGAITETIKQRCEQLAAHYGRRLEVVIHTKGVSAGEAQETYDYVNRLFRQSGYQPGEIVADFTGGTKPMSIGMIMACLPTERELEYVALHPKTRVMTGPFLIDYQHSAFDLVG